MVDTFRVEIGAGRDLPDRLGNKDTTAPSGWELAPGSYPQTDLVVHHTINESLPHAISIWEHKDWEPHQLHGYHRINADIYSDIDLTRIEFKDLTTGTRASRPILILIQFTQIPK